MISSFQLRVGVLANFLVGVAIASLIHIDEGFFMLAIFFLIFVVFYKYGTITWGTFFISSLFGVFWFTLFSPPTFNSNNDFAFYSGKTVNIHGHITEIHEKFNVTDLVINIDRIFQLSLSGKVLVRDFLHRTWNVSDTVFLSGTVTLLHDEFDPSYVRYLQGRGVSVFLSDATIEFIRSDTFTIRGAFSTLRRALLQRIRMLFPEPEASFLSGLLIGDRSGLSPVLKGAFQKTSLSHVLAVSGYNVSLVLLFFAYIFRFFSPRIRLILSFGGVIFFVLLVGLDASAVRAGLMGILGLIGFYFGRPQQTLWMILLAAVLMTLVNPRWLMFDASFQLSFAATLGLVLGASSLQRFFAWSGRILSHIAAATFAAQIATMPIVWWYFGSLSFIGFFANLIVVPFISFATVLAVVSLIIQFVLGHEIASFLVWPEFLLVRFILWLVVSFSFL